MCGRYLSFTESEIIAAQTLLQLPNRGAFVPDKGEIYPSQTAPILINSGYDVACTDGRWGFARWDGKGVLINARSETAHSSRVFSPYYTTERCLVPAHGYFEWRKTGKTSEKYLFTGDGGLYLAGLMRMEQDAVLAFVILTRAAQTEFMEIHDRMPVVVPYAYLKDWLRARVDAPTLAGMSIPLTKSLE